MSLKHLDDAMDILRSAMCFMVFVMLVSKEICQFNLFQNNNRIHFKNKNNRKVQIAMTWFICLNKHYKMFAVFLIGFNVSTDAEQFKIKTGKIQHNFEVGKSNKLLYHCITIVSTAIIHLLKISTILLLERGKSKPLRNDGFESYTP